MPSFRRRSSVLATLALLGILFPISAAPTLADSGASVPSGFTDKLVWSLADPAVIAFAPDGTVFVGQKSGKILAYDSLSDTTATTVADLSNDVHNYWDRGLLGLAVDPQYPTRPYLYALYTYDHQPGNGNDVPRWGGGVNDLCPNPPGGNTNGCVVSGRLERLTLNGSNVMTSRTSLVTDWCQQFPSHSIGSLAFGPEGALYVSAGDGASFNEVDIGQLGQSYWGSNPCSDPTNEGGALRSQDVRTSGDTTGLNGTILRIDPDTGDAWPDNANAGSSDANKAKIIGYGLRNPFRMTVRSDGAVWIGDVGWNTWEEINKISDPDGTPPDFGWPCYEGSTTQPDYQSFGTAICNGLTSQTGPVFKYKHTDSIVGGDGCTTGSSSISGIAFRGTNGNYPNSYDNGLFFGDYSRKCIWFVPDSGGSPNFNNVQVFANLIRSDSSPSGGAVDVKVSPSGVVVYADLNRDEVRQITYNSNGSPTAAFTATPSSGSAPLTVNFDASGSSDPDGDTLTYAWDLDGDGQYDDSTAKKPSKTYSSNGAVSVGLQVSDGALNDTIHHTVSVGLSKPTATIDTPSSSLKWHVGEDIPFSGHATDAQDGDLPDSAFDWTLKIEHCPSNCHEHVVTHFTGKSGSFDAPNHDYPSYLRLSLTVTDSSGLTDTKSVDLHPETGTMDAASDPSSIPLTVAHSIAIVGSQIDVSAPATFKLGEETWAFDHWSDGGARAHGATVTDGATHLLATYAWQSSQDATSSCSSAPVGEPANYYLRGRLDTGTDVDWYRFKVTYTRSIRIVLGSLPADASLKLYKGCSTLLATADRTGTGPEEIIKSLPAGTYAVRVAAKGTSSSDPYQLLIKRLSSGLSVMSSNAQVDSGAGTLNLVGEVWNEYSTTRGPITVTAKLYDDEGHLLTTRSAAAVLYAKSHARAPFRISGSLPSGFSRVVYSVSAPVANKTPRGVKVIDYTIAQVSGHWKATGHLKATSGAVKYLKLAFVLYDDRLRVLDVVRGTVGSSTLSSNQTTSFSATSTPADLDIGARSLKTFGFKP